MATLGRRQVEFPLNTVLMLEGVLRLCGEELGSFLYLEEGDFSDKFILDNVCKWLPFKRFYKIFVPLGYPYQDTELWKLLDPSTRFSEIIEYKKATLA